MDFRGFHLDVTALATLIGSVASLILAVKGNQKRTKSKGDKDASKEG